MLTKLPSYSTGASCCFQRLSSGVTKDLMHISLQQNQAMSFKKWNYRLSQVLNGYPSYQIYLHIVYVHTHIYIYAYIEILKTPMYFEGDGILLFLAVRRILLHQIRLRQDLISFKIKTCTWSDWWWLTSWWVQLRDTEFPEQQWDQMERSSNIFKSLGL